ncbi:hypothetical protein N7475_002062 [Penicillium sp. IBT 31633x]|nr:hypothetical protein N7475_002062 [Penicillium sp. IBT 31633x]
MAANLLSREIQPAQATEYLVVSITGPGIDKGRVHHAVVSSLIHNQSHLATRSLGTFIDALRQTGHRISGPIDNSLPGN